MLKFLKKYRFNIILILVLIVLSFWFQPTQEDLYLKADFKLIEKKSKKALLWTMAAGAIIILILVLKGTRQPKEIGNSLLGIIVLSMPVYLVFRVIFLSGFLALNRIEQSDRFEKKYTTALFLEADKKTPVIHDFKTGTTLYREKVMQNQKLNSLNAGDTIVISFRKGLLGVPFDPVIK